MNNEKIINFMGARNWVMGVSLVLCLVALVSFGVRGFNLGLDFTGGTLLELHYDRPANLETVRQQLSEAGYPGAVVVHFGSENELLVRLQSDTSEDGEKVTANIGEAIADALRQRTPGVDITLTRSEIIGAQIGEEMATNGILGLLVAFGTVFIYVAVRFQTKFSVATIVSQVFDALILLGVFSLFQLDFDLTVLAAVLAANGYSLNDSIVVADRIRENFRILRTETTEEIINISLTQVLGRTVITSGTTLMVLIALYLFGGELLENFSIALIIGVIVGTFSSIFVMSPAIVWMKLTREDLMPPVKEGAELDELP
ncbi:protein translocase subunit SecF [Saccharophagus sp. K07]|uniref:protein translocase subunit SecF n=1 Tax=Saccharophagus sp. K07 TaxID=2283636 RepID=UPI0016520608|nr:protein translocase subunit SecF [Saccharophagus sp. K07]MBC6905710.1 protein translocase subunit SecF [Saccharophagus sp. K07]